MYCTEIYNTYYTKKKSISPLISSINLVLCCYSFSSKLWTYYGLSKLFSLMEDTGMLWQKIYSQ